MSTHTYDLTVAWTGNTGSGTSSYRAYSRDATITVAGGPPTILASSDPAFRGDPSRWNPEQLLVAAVAQCHMLWYLHLCAVGGVAVMSYADDATGIMEEEGAGRFTSVTLRPKVGVSQATMLEDAVQLHDEAHKMCFIANSVNFPVAVEPEVALVV